MYFKIISYIIPFFVGFFNLSGPFIENIYKILYNKLIIIYSDNKYEVRNERIKS